MEQRVAELVVLGRRNREIADELFVSIATVEAHLTRIYRKLHVRSRTELARAMR
jgi:DNA-binding NarL/FixJ family response regulator